MTQPLTSSLRPRARPTQGSPLDPKCGCTPKQKLPAFQKLWDEYQHGEAHEAKAAIGGNVDAEYIENTCVVRVSRSLNYAGSPVKANKGMLTVKGGDGMRYGLRVAEMDAYMRKVYGAPSLEVTSASGVGVDPALFAGKKGIIMFDVSGWSDATGHFDLWNGTEAAHGEYFADATKVAIWETD